MEKMILDEYAFYKMGQKLLDKDKQEMNLFYNDKKNFDMSIYTMKENLPGHLSWYFQMEKLKLAEYKDGCVGAENNSKQSKYYKNSGIMNLIPYLLELNLMNTWNSQIKKVTVTKQLSSTRSFLHEIWDFPFPLQKREGNMYFQLFNNIKENGKLIFQSRSIDPRVHDPTKYYKVPDHVQKETLKFLPTCPKN